MKDMTSRALDISSYKKLKAEIDNQNATLVAVSKTKPVAAIRQLYDEGHRVFGENRAQELAAKYESLPGDIQWHMVGHLQTNKVKHIAAFVAMVHSVDRKKVLKEINKQARKNERTIPCLLQFHIAEESSKHGFTWEEAEEMLQSEAFKGFKNTYIAGVMGMATFTNDERQIRKEFRELKGIFDRLRNKYFSEQKSFKEISMGMTGDYKIALEEGATIVRIGSMIFGERD